MTCRVKTRIRLGIHSDSPSDQSPCCPHEETLGPYLHIAKCCGVTPRNVAEFLREISGRKPSAKKVISIFPCKKIISHKGCSTAKREKRAFFGLFCICK